MKNRLKHIVIGILITVLFMACRKKCHDGDVVSKSIDKEAYSYFSVFQKGNYWVYKTSDLLQKDSLFLASSSHVTIRNSTACIDEENLFFTLKSTGHNLIISDSVCVNVVNIEVNTDYCKNSTLFIGGGSFIFGNNIICTNSSSVKRDSTVNLNGSVFNGAIMEVIDRNDDTLFFQENVGVIGWKRNNQTFNLTQYFIQ